MDRRNIDPKLVSPVERRRLYERWQEDIDFCQQVMAALRALEQLRNGAEDPDLLKRLEAAQYLRGASIHRIPPHVMKIVIPAEVNAHTSIYWRRDEDKPSLFIAKAVQKLTPEQVEFTETQGDIHNNMGKYLVVEDNFDKLKIDVDIDPIVAKALGRFAALNQLQSRRRDL